MGNAIWLLWAVPDWYFSTLLDPFGASLLSLVPAAGAVFLIVGMIGAIRRRQRRLLAFILPFVASEAFVALAGFYRGHDPEPDGQVLTFIGLQLLLAAALVAYAKRPRWPALALALFSITYALFAGFVATMSFSDRWL